MSITTNMETKKDLIKRTICKGISDDEMELLLMVCKRTGLDPFAKQVYAVKRWSPKDKKEIMTIQTSIDGLRLIAERTGNYSPGREPSYQYDGDKKIVSATSYVKKRTSDGTWHEVAATAYFEEYAQRYENKQTGETGLSNFWQKMPHVMLAKCAEALALRKAFPAEMSGLYTDDEMSQADKTPIEAEITEEQYCAQVDALMISIDDKDYLSKLSSYVSEKMNVPSIYDVAPRDYKKIINSLEKKLKEKEVVNGSEIVA